MLINLIVTVVLLTIVNGFKAPLPSHDVGEGEHVEPCQKWIKCEAEDKAALDEFDACLNQVPEEKMKKLTKIMADYAKTEWSGIEAAYKDYCAWDDKRQNEHYAEAVQQLSEEYSSTCADSLQAATCTEMTELSECFIDVLNRVHDEEKC
ncbi:uncharacterized protein [Parasteatoda tepidariorum]|uniref:uncharacterized protein n=1 Tax=Parasteatoda tepidariorum TaxID=114398 RepID=UPI001C71DF72|nr:uncharacterized protein LOC107448382 [Parasteatoda tepidariorum]